MNISPVSFTGIVNKWKNSKGEWCRTYYPFKDEKLAQFNRDNDSPAYCTNSKISSLVDEEIGHDKDCKWS